MSLWTLGPHGCVAWDLQKAVSYSSLGGKQGGQSAGSRVGRTGKGKVGVRKLLSSREGGRGVSKKLSCVGVERTDA